MNSSLMFRNKVILWLLFTTLLASCQKHLTVSKSDYKQYSIDQQVDEDSSLVKYYAPFKAKIEVEMGRVVGETVQALTKPSEPETLLGNFFADAMLREGLKIDPSIQFVLATKGGLRITWPKGNITVSHVFELMPFENEMVTMKLTGANVQELADFVAKKDGEPVAGLRMQIKDEKAVDITIAGQPLDYNKTYTLLTYDYLADGGDNLAFLRKGTDRRDIGKKLRDAILEHISDLTKQGKKINAELDGRITIVKE
jgi:2',3'-cyclic-nucleotide 2'-phosphodiesterase (5'-nucleotidase family)